MSLDVLCPFFSQRKAQHICTKLSHNAVLQTPLSVDLTTTAVLVFTFAAVLTELAQSSLLLQHVRRGDVTAVCLTVIHLPLWQAVQ